MEKWRGSNSHFPIEFPALCSVQEPCLQQQAVASSTLLGLQEAASQVVKWGCMLFLILPKPGSGFVQGVVQPVHMCMYLCLQLYRRTIRSIRRLKTTNTANITMPNTSPESSACSSFTHPYDIFVSLLSESCITLLSSSFESCSQKRKVRFPQQSCKKLFLEVIRGVVKSKFHFSPLPWHISQSRECAREPFTDSQKS